MTSNMVHISSAAAIQHIDYNMWATRRLLDAAAPLTPEQLRRDFGTADRSIFGTLSHLLRSETAWLSRIENEGQGPAIPPIEDIQQLAGAWSELHVRWSRYMALITDPELEKVHHYHDLKGNPRNNALWEILIHVVNHSTHHRGQVAGFLRATGLTPPPLDYIAYLRLK